MVTNFVKRNTVNSDSNDNFGFCKASANYLLERGISLSIARKLGFRTISQFEGKEKINQAIGGLLIPYYDIEGNLVTHRLRPFELNWDQSPKLRDYYLERDPKLPKFLSKPKSEDDQRVNKAYFPQCIDWKEVKRSTKYDIAITEGEIKALSACLSDIPTIALAGVNCFVNRVKVEDQDLEAGKKEIKEFLPELEWQVEIENPITNETEIINKWKGRSVALIFDSDIVSKDAVKNALVSLAIELYKRGAKPFLVLLPTEYDGSKNGIDDFIVKHGATALKKLIQQWKVVSKKPKLNPLKIWKHKKTGEILGAIEDLEPIESIKGLMAWSCLKTDFKYRDGFGWYQWQGKHWELLPNDNKLLGILREFHYQNDWLFKKDKSCLEDLRNLLTTESIVFDPPNILAFQNGYLNTDTNELLPHDKSLFVTSILPFDYNPMAKCPTWLKFLNFALRGDQNKIASLRAWIRWILTPKLNKKFAIEATLWLIGKQGTGKGTFLDVLVQLVGENNCGSFDPNSLNNPNMLFGLADKKLSINSDVSGFIGDIGNYNKICSNEFVPVKNLYHNVSQTRLNTVTVLAMNEVLAFSGKSADGLKRRLHVIDFDNPPSESDRDPELSEKLEKELSGIFHWAWQLTLPQTKQILKWRSSEAVQEIYQNNQTEIQFLIDKYPNGNEAGSIEGKILYQEYSEWCKENGHHRALSSTSFGTQIKKVKGISFNRLSDGIRYVIPPMVNYYDGDFGLSVDEPISILNQLSDNNLNQSDNDIDINLDASIDSDIDKSIDSDIDANTKQVSHLEINKQKEDLGKYEDFKTVSTVQSLEIKALKKRAEKVKKAILECSDKSELDALRKDATFSNDEINWVWKNLLTEGEKERIIDISKRQQTELNFEGNQIDFTVMIEEIKHRLINQFNLTEDKARKQWIKDKAQSKFNQEINLKDLFNNPQYDEFWINLLTELRQGENL